MKHPTYSSDEPENVIKYVNDGSGRKVRDEVLAVKITVLLSSVQDENITLVNSSL